MTARRPRSAEAAAKRDLAALPPLYRDSALGVTYLVLARRVDTGVSTADAIKVASEMRRCLLALHALSPAKRAGDPADELARRRDERMKREATAE